MDLTQWFRNQLQASGDGLVWAVEQLPVERRYARPPRPLGDWSVARHAFHMLYNEQNIVLPRLRQWIYDPSPPHADLNEDAAWDEGHNLERVLTAFRAVRAEQIGLLSKLGGPIWDELRDTAAGRVTLRWVLTKSYQHTLDHVNGILRIALFWDRFAIDEE